MNLQDRISKDFKGIHKRANVLFDFYASELGQFIELAGADTVASVAGVLSMLPDTDYRTLKHHHTIDSLQQLLYRRWDMCAGQIETYWGDKRNDFDLLSRLSVSFISKKSSPPWANTLLDLKSSLSTDGDFDPRTGHIRFYFRKMVDAIMQQIQQGALQEESLNQILMRVRKFFKRNKKKTYREDDRRVDVPVEFSQTIDEDTSQAEASMMGPAKIDEGTYTLEDVDRFVGDQERAMNWSARQYRPWFDEDVKANNRYLRDLEQILMSDAVDQLHQGLMSIGPKEMGIKDFVWVVTHTPTLCDCCDKRSGMSMTDIKAKIKDQFKDQPPPLHPNCRCQLAPKISDDWTKNAVKDGDSEWDSNTGIVYRADKQERSLGVNNMTFDQYLQNIPKP